MQVKATRTLRAKKIKPAPKRKPLAPLTPTEFWSGEEGDRYTARNRVDWKARQPFWQDILDRTNAKSFLEVGCNAGWNLQCLTKLRPEAVMSGIDLNEDALREANKVPFDVWKGGAVDLPLLTGDNGEFLFPSGCCELSFTCGVLIHIPPDDLRQAMAAIRDVSSQYVLAVEYDNPIAQEIEYRERKGLLWKRPYGKLYQDLGLSLVESGVAQGFDDCTYWLLER